MSTQTERKPSLPPRIVITAAWLVHRALYRLTGGRFGLRRPSDKTYGMMRIDTTGKRIRRAPWPKPRWSAARGLGGLSPAW